jgi:hypothetical protein
MIDVAIQMVAFHPYYLEIVFTYLVLLLKLIGTKLIEKLCLSSENEVEDISGSSHSDIGLIIHNIGNVSDCHSVTKRNILVAL